MLFVPVTKPVKDLSTIEYRACATANFGDYGYMKQYLSDARTGHTNDTHAIMLTDGPVIKVSNLKAWSLVLPARHLGIASNKPAVMVWVKRQYRRQGLGSQLMIEAKKFHKRPYVIPHDTASSHLFSAFKVDVPEHERHWLINKPIVA